MKTDLTKYGFKRGAVERWCYGCDKPFEGDRAATSCEACAGRIEATPDAELVRYGFTPGDVERWCASCNVLFPGGPKAFKCRPCAAKQYDRVNRDCDEAGMTDDDC